MAPPDQPVRFSHRITHLVRVPDALVLVEDTAWHLVEEPSTVAVLQLVDHRRSAAELAGTAGDVVGAARVHFILLELERLGVVSGVERHGLGTDLIPDTCAPVMTAEQLRLAEALEDVWGRAEFGIALVPGEAWGEELGRRLLLVDDYLRGGLDDRVAELGRHEEVGSVVLARVGAEEAWLGPVVGDSAACLRCLRRRLRQTLPLRDLVHTPEPLPGIGLFAVPRTEGTARGPCQTLARALVADKPDIEQLSNEIRVWHGSGERTVHSVPPSQPGCTCCRGSVVPGSNAVAKDRAPTVLLRSNGGYRAVSPEETWRLLRRHIDPLTGLVSHLQRVEMPSDDLVAYTGRHVTHEVSLTLDSLRRLRRDSGGGKGRTDIDARVSGLCECLERYSALHQGGETTHRARASAVEGPRWLPNDLLGYSPRQYEERREWNPQQHGLFQLVPQPYDDEVIEWTETVDLVTRRSHLVPAAYVYSSFQGDGTRFCRADSNGLSAGNCRGEAILQGFFELVERDAVALWWYNRVRRPAVAMPEADPWIESLSAAHLGLGREVWLLDLTTDLGIAVYAAVSAVIRGERPEIVFGFGAHVDSGIALRRALTELNQMLPSVLQSEDRRKSQLLPDFADALHWWERTRLEQVDYLLPDPEARPTSLEKPSLSESAGFEEIIGWCVARVAEQGLSFLVHDLTRPETGLPTVKVIVPGLRHFWRRLGPGRLYDVPVALGWLDEELDESEMNPVSLFV